MAEPAIPVMKSRRRIACPKAQDYANDDRLHQGFTTCGMGFTGQFAQQQSWAAHVRFGSKADIDARLFDVRFTPKSGHWRDCSTCALKPPDENYVPAPGMKQRI
jgi:hypothetical protein